MMVGQISTPVNNSRIQPNVTAAITPEQADSFLEEDQALVNEFVKGKLWETFKFVCRSVNVADLDNGLIFVKFYQHCGHRLANGRLGSENERKRYAKRLWERISRRTSASGRNNPERKTVTAMINDNRNGVYTTMQARFQGKTGWEGMMVY
jgi:hypothetical protein